MILEEEMRSRLRAIMADCKGLILDLKGWKRTSQESVKHLWLSDCESLVCHLKNPKNERIENVRLSIDVQGLKQVLWKKADGTDLEELLSATLAENAVRWIDINCMIVDCLTEKMKPDVTHRLQEDGKLSLKATGESVTEKMCRRKNRTAKTAMIMIHDISIGAARAGVRAH
jgi:hypothetical protein